MDHCNQTAESNYEYIVNVTGEIYTTFLCFYDVNQPFYFHSKNELQHSLQGRSGGNELPQLSFVQ